MFAAPGRSRAFSSSSISTLGPAEEVLPRARVRADPPPPGTASAPSCARRSTSPRGTSGSSRSAPRARRRRRSSSRRPTTSAPGSQTASAGCCSACAETVLGPGARVRVVARRRRDAARRRRPARAARRRPQRAQPAADLRPVRDRRRATGSPTPPRWPSPRCPGWPTTRSSSAARPGSARPTCCTRSPTTSTEHGDGHDRPLHDRRGVHRPLRRRAPRRRAWRPSRRAYRGVDVLLVDDVQFLQSKAKTEEEFFHTFNALHQAGAQLVLTSDRLPRDLDALEDRLRERFEAGLV